MFSFKQLSGLSGTVSTGTFFPVGINNMDDRYTKSRFIPFRRNDIVEMCVADGKLKPDDEQRFRQFCKIIIAYYHHLYHDTLLKLKDHFVPIDPDSPYKKLKESDAQHDEESINAFFDDFEKLLQKANYEHLSQEEIEKSFQDKTLIHLNYNIAFDEIQHYVIYYRGLQSAKAKIKRYFLFWQEIEFDMFERVILVLKFKDEEYFKQKGIRTEHLNFHPGRTYIYYYKHIPVNDLEILFPNVRIRMTWKDTLLFLVPAVGAGIGSLSKVLSNIAIVVGFILLYFGLHEYAERLNIEVSEELINQSVYPILLAASSILLVLGGFAVKQFLSYKNKYIRFMKTITETLFFRNISVNSGVFQTLLDSAEEEECEEAILAYYHLLTSETPLTKQDLDRRIEAWFREGYDVHMDFDVEDAINKLNKLRGEVSEYHDGMETTTEKRVLYKNGDGTLTVPPLQETLVILDSIWDDLFKYDTSNVPTPAVI